VLALSIPALNAIAAMGIVIAVALILAVVTLIALAIHYGNEEGSPSPAVQYPSLYRDGDYDGGIARWERRNAIAKKARRGAVYAIPIAAILAVGSLGIAVWALSTASLRTDQNIPGRLDRRQVDVNIDNEGSQPTGVIVGGG
jgi:hypothetical protein